MTFPTTRIPTSACLLLAQLLVYGQPLLHLQHRTRYASFALRWQQYLLAYLHTTTQPSCHAFPSFMFTLPHPLPTPCHPPTPPLCSPPLSHATLPFHTYAYCLPFYIPTNTFFKLPTTLPSSYMCQPPPLCMPPCTFSFCAMPPPPFSYTTLWIAPP